MSNVIIVTTASFDRDAKKLLSVEALESLFDYLKSHPEKGEVIQGTGGVRKMRWKTGKNNKGKSGGVRILYHYSGDVFLLILIGLYSKAVKENITKTEKNELRQLMPQFVMQYKEGLK